MHTKVKAFVADVGGKKALMVKLTINNSKATVKQIVSTNSRFLL
ncbi:hypothetical protein M23134_00660 [Microscilla marina ATCC 23134]|uniref:Uncharacterized protein n=1 Tax=Microscilla marina ATCC 23134 TaxID=313606 RepID=A1ZVL8_MICM2|nr:hypothetical protein M23134_00660 [Microscilla marina ATCC 23134]